MTPSKDLIGNELRPSSSIVKVKIGNRLFTAHRSTSCVVCNHPIRHEIEMAIIANYGFSSIANRFSEMEHVTVEGERIELPKVEIPGLRLHYQRHMPIEPAMMRRIAELRAEELGRNLDQENDQFVDAYILAKSVMRQTFTRMAAGDIAPEINHGLAAAKLVNDIEERAEAQSSNEVWAQAMTVYFESVQRIMAPDQFAELMNELDNNAVLKGLAAKINGRNQRDDDMHQIEAYGDDNE